jgi:hypothetical protein
MIDGTSADGDKPGTLVGDIEFDNVSFTYPARQETPVCLSYFFPSICSLMIRCRLGP